MSPLLLHTINARLRAVARRLVPSALLAWRHRRIRERTHSHFRHLPNTEVFSQIYDQQLWGGAPGEFYSGHGSDAQYGSVYVEAIRRFIADHGINRVIDVGCGDFRIGRQLRDGIDYTGVDVVPRLIASHQQSFADEHTRFLCLDVTVDQLPPADLCLVRQVLQHLSNDEIARVLDRCSAFPYLVVTEHFPREDLLVAPNLDKPHGPDIRASLGSAICLDQAPFFRRIERVLCEVRVESDGSSIRTVLLGQGAR